MFLLQRLISCIETPFNYFQFSFTSSGGRGDGGQFGDPGGSGFVGHLRPRVHPQPLPPRFAPATSGDQPVPCDPGFRSK